MPSLKTHLPLGFGLPALLLVSSAAFPPWPVSAALAEEPPAAAGRAPARVYTNDDLDRVRRFRDETGVRSVPAVPAGERPTARAADERPRSRGEDYWREEARRVRDRVADLAEKAEELRARIAAEEEERRLSPRTSRGQRSRASLSSGPDPATASRLASIEKRMRALEDDLAERARRDNALPGWLR